MCSTVDTQRELLQQIQSFIAAEGYPPSQTELARALRVTQQAVADRLGRLRTRGLVDWIAGQPRTLRLTDAGKDALGTGGSAEARHAPIAAATASR